MASMKTLNTITSAHWQPELGHPGSVVEGLSDIGQAIQVILLTPKGSDPHRPDFGTNNHHYLDWPTNIITPYLVRESIEAIQRWETRITVIQVNIDIEESTVAVRVVWKVADGVPTESKVEYERTGTT